MIQAWTDPSIRTSFESQHSIQRATVWAERDPETGSNQHATATISQSVMEKTNHRLMTIRGLFLILVSLICVNSIPSEAQPKGSHTPLPDQYNSENWIIVNEGQSPIQTKQYEITLINKDSIRNTTGSRWDFDLAFLQWDTYADPNHHALTRNDLGKGNWVDCNKGMYVVEWHDQNTSNQYYYSRSGKWLLKEEFGSEEWQHPEADWEEFGRLGDNRMTRVFNQICGTTFKTRK